MMVILISICSNAAPIHCPAYGSKIVLQLIDVLMPTFAQRIIRRWVSGTMSGSYNRCLIAIRPPPPPCRHGRWGGSAQRSGARSHSWPRLVHINRRERSGRQNQKAKAVAAKAGGGQTRGSAGVAVAEPSCASRQPESCPNVG